MSKELEALECLVIFERFFTDKAHKEPNNPFNDNWLDNIEIIKQALQRLEAIDNAKPSEALEETKLLRGFNKTELKNDKNVNKALDIIQQALLKAQEMEKEPKEILDILKNKPFILQRIFEEKGLENQEEFDKKYFWGTITWEEEFEIMRWLDGKETNTN